MRKLFFTLSLALVPLAALGEGMWMPQQVPQISAELKKAGLKLDTDKIKDLTGHPMGAVVQIPGCTASFVSEQGLLITNHHCAEGSIQHNSTPEHDYLTDGFLAKSMTEELPASPGFKVWVTTSIEDVTKTVTGNIPAKKTDLERYNLIDQRRKQIVADCEKQGGVRCLVPVFFEGSQYLKITQMEIRDVRLVYAPPGGIGVYGGETDNWMWPRHTGDFSFLRAYVGKDGKAADFSKDNVPYRPKHFLEFATDGINEGDFVFVAGYPGTTYRYRTADEVRNSQEFTVPTYIRYANALNQILEAESKRSKEVEILNASRIRSNANLLKNYQGTAEVFATGSVLNNRTKREADLAAFLATDRNAQQKYGTALAEISKLNQQIRSTRERDAVITWLFRSSPMLTQARELYRLSLERPKADLARAAGYQERDWPSIKNSIDRAQKQIDVASDRAGLRYFLKEASILPAGQRIKAVDDALAATGATGVDAQIDAFLDKLYATTKLADAATRHAMMNETTAQLKARNDAMLNFGAAITDVLLAKEARDNAVLGAMSRVRPLYLEALREMGGGAPIFPDANSTLRVTFGHVKGYKPRDAVWYTPQTTLSGLVKKDKGEGEFNSPKTLLAASSNAALTKEYIDPQLGEVPVNFLSTCDTTGGNSGSPTLDAEGKFCGILFDGNYEALGSDYLVNPDVTRSIHVDGMYILWVMDAVDKAHNLLREMKLPVRYN